MKTRYRAPRRWLQWAIGPALVLLAVLAQAQAGAIRPPAGLAARM